MGEEEQEVWAVMGLPSPVLCISSLGPACRLGQSWGSGLGWVSGFCDTPKPWDFPFPRSVREAVLALAGRETEAQGNVYQAPSPAPTVLGKCEIPGVPLVY